MGFSSNLFLKNLREQVNYRYQKELYAGFSKPAIYHFIYGYFRIIIEVLKTFSYFFLYVKSVAFKKRGFCKPIALYNTHNQKKALLNLRDSENLQFEIYHISQISLTYIYFRFFTWIIKLFFFPISFLMAGNRSGAFHSSFIWFVALYNQILLIKIEKKITDLYISNDHVGDIFILSILARSSEVKVHYVQHGAVKPEFPVNYFDSIYVQNTYYRDIYSRLAKNESVKIVVCNADYGNPSVDYFEKVDVLIAFSHQFYLIPSIRLVKKIRDFEKVAVIRFHPSDRLALFKYRILRLFNSNILYSAADQLSLWEDFDRSSIQICASSSVLLDAYKRDGGKSLIWYKPIGLKWDYYDLGDKLNVVSTIEELSLHEI